MTTTTLYNLARAYEELGETEIAKEAYTKLIGRVGGYWDGESFVLQVARMFTNCEQPKSVLPPFMSFGINTQRRMRCSSKPSLAMLRAILT